MKNGRYFNFRDICDRNLWDTGYLVKKLQGYGILRPPPPPPNGASLILQYHSEPTEMSRAFSCACTQLLTVCLSLDCQNF